MILDKSEKSKTDKKRERRKKKLKQKLHVRKTINKNLLGNKTDRKDVKGKNIQKVCRYQNFISFFKFFVLDERDIKQQEFQVIQCILHTIAGASSKFY